MFLIRKFLLIFFLLFPISNSFGAPVTLVHTTQFNDGPSPGGIEFNKDGTKMIMRQFMYMIYQHLLIVLRAPELTLETAKDVF